MGVRLRNLTFRELTERHQFTLTEKELTTLEALRQDDASVEKGTDKCHPEYQSNCYVCEKCGESIVTIEKIEDGQMVGEFPTNI